MKKISTFIFLSLMALSSITQAYEEGDRSSPWTGFYLGANAGYIWSANNIIHERGEPSFANPAFIPNSQSDSAALAVLGTRVIFNAHKGFMGGAQIGYDNLILDKLVIGIDADIDGLSNASNTTAIVNTVPTTLFGTYTANISVSKKLNYLGLLKGRLGYLFTPSVLAYGAGAFAYGGISLDTLYSVTSTNAAFLPINQSVSETKLLSGWAAGGGIEWLYSSSWSVKLEYLFYNLGPKHTHLTVTQTLTALPGTPYASAIIESVARYTENTVRVGVNYHFA